MSNNFRLLAIVLMFGAGPSFAEEFEARTELNNAPIVDITVESGLAEEVASLRQQVQVLQQQNILSKVKELQSEIRALRGAIDIESHNIAKLKGAMGAKDVALETKAPVAAVSQDPSGSEIETYNNAFAILKERDYEGATEAFSNFLVNFPDGKYAPNAHYWLGEIYLLKGNYKNAELSFKTVIDEHPRHGKTADAIFKLAMVYVNTNEIDKAKELVAKLEESYPDTTAYRMAKIQLRNI